MVVGLKVNWLGTEGGKKIHFEIGNEIEKIQVVQGWAMISLKVIVVLELILAGVYVWSENRKENKVIEKDGQSLKNSKNSRNFGRIESVETTGITTKC